MHIYIFVSSIHTQHVFTPHIRACNFPLFRAIVMTIILYLYLYIDSIYSRINECTYRLCQHVLVPFHLRVFQRPNPNPIYERGHDRRAICSLAYNHDRQFPVDANAPNRIPLRPHRNGTVPNRSLAHRPYCKCGISNRHLKNKTNKFIINIIIIIIRLLLLLLYVYAHWHSVRGL